MCDQNIKKRLLNGDGESMKAQSEGIANLMDSSDKILAFLHAFKVEMFAYIDNSLAIHAKSCGEARVSSEVANASKKPAEEKNSLKLAIGKFLGFEAHGKVGMILSALFWIIVGAVATVCILHATEVNTIVKGVSP